MFEKFFKIRMKSINKNNKGMALISAIVIIGFVAALVSIILTTSLVNFKMKSVETRSKDTFYSAEQVLDEINVYLQKVVSDSMSTAYLDIMNNYATYDSQKKTEMLEAKYYENIWKEIGYDLGSTLKSDQYDVTKLEDWVKDTTIWHGDPVTGYGAIIVAVAEDGSESKVGKMTTYKESGVVLEKLKVYYKDEKGFVSVIQTDIRLSYPEFDFAASSELPSLPFYSIIADKELDIKSSVSASVVGNVYANQLTIDGGNKNNTNVQVNIGDDSDVLTVKYDIDIQPYVDFKSGKNAVIWAKNIVVDTSSVDLDGTVHVSNDLNLRGTSPSATVKGEYLGFGNSLTDSDKSSAIIINGEDSSIDMSKLNSLTLLGHGFFETSASVFDKNSFIYKNTEDDAETLLNKDKNGDIMMGESLAVKSNQLLYLVPAEAIGVDENTKRSLYNANPLTYEQYTRIKDLINDDTDKCDYVELADDVEIAALGETLTDYVARKKVGKETYPVCNKVFVRTSEPTGKDPKTGQPTYGLVYFYMKFKEPNADYNAERFFKKYYENNKEGVSNYLEFYLSKMKIHDLETLATAANAGPVLVGDKTKEDGFNVDINPTKGSESELAVNINDKYTKRFESMCSNLVSSNDNIKYKYDVATFAKSFKEETETLEAYGALSVDQKNALSADEKKRIAGYQTVFDNLIDETEFAKFFADFPTTVEPYNGALFEKTGNEIRVYYYDEATGTKDSSPYAIISNDATGTIEINNGDADKNLCLVISKGKVNVKRGEFKGLILSDNVVTLNNSNAVVSANPGEVRRVLATGYMNSIKSVKPYNVARLLKEGSEFIYSSLDPKGDTSNLSLGNLITYENWSKE